MRTPPTDRVQHLRVVSAPEPAKPRFEGGQIEDHFAPILPWANLPEAGYWASVQGWVLRPFRRVTREPRKNASEPEVDWRLILHLEVFDVDQGDLKAPAARSALFQYELSHDRRRPKIPHGFRVAVGKDSGRWRVPRGGTLWNLLGATGERADTLTARIADSLLDWHLLVSVHTPTRRAGHKAGIPGPRIPLALRHSWGLHVEDARQPSPANRGNG
jgi:hypothetical protein